MHKIEVSGVWERSVNMAVLLERDLGSDHISRKCFFFFSSRRRHTRLQGDWSSDVCSSDLVIPASLYADSPVSDLPGAHDLNQEAVRIAEFWRSGDFGILYLRAGLLQPLDRKSVV